VRFRKAKFWALVLQNFIRNLRDVSGDARGAYAPLLFLFLELEFLRDRFLTRHRARKKAPSNKREKAGEVRASNYSSFSFDFVKIDNDK